MDLSACVWQYVCDERRSLNSLQDWKRSVLTHAWHGWAFIRQTIVNMMDFFCFFVLHARILSPLSSPSLWSLWAASSDPELLSNEAAVRTGERTALCGVLSGCGVVVMLRSNGSVCAVHTDAPAEPINGAMFALTFSFFSGYKTSYLTDFIPCVFKLIRKI